MLAYIRDNMIPTKSQVAKGLQHPMKAIIHIGESVGWSLLRLKYDTRGVSILDEDWDTLIILDACRYDVFKNTNDLGGELKKKRSIASATSHFLIDNFKKRTAYDTVYLSANPKIGIHRDQIDVFKLVGMWTPGEKIEKQSQINPRSFMDPDPVIGRAMELHNEYPNKRHIIHLMPPHVPHIWKDGKELPSNSPYRTYEAARNGEILASTMREVYQENLNHTLTCLKPLLANITGKVVLSSDHGELLGEGIPIMDRFLHRRWSMDELEKFDFGHYGLLNVPLLREVPWLEIDAGARRNIVEDEPKPPDITTESIDEQLEALGYR